MSDKRKRVTGHTVSTTDAQLEKTSAEMLMMEGGKNYKAPTPFEINGVVSNIFDDSVNRKAVCNFLLVSKLVPR